MWYEKLLSGVASFFSQGSQQPQPAEDDHSELIAISIVGGLMVIVVLVIILILFKNKKI